MSACTVSVMPMANAVRQIVVSIEHAVLEPLQALQPGQPRVT